MATNILTKVLDGPKPALAVTFASEAHVAAAAEIAKVVDITEFRADLFPNLTQDYLIDQLKKLDKLPVLFLMRWAAENGGWKGPEAERLALFTALSQYADGFDIELNATEIAAEVIALAHKQGKPVVVSNHDFKATPSRAELEKMFERSKGLGADYVKFAATVGTKNDFETLVRFTMDHKQDGVIVAGMGKLGTALRGAVAFLGSRLTYSAADKKPVATGQLGYLETAKFLGRS